MDRAAILIIYESLGIMLWWPKLGEGHGRALQL